MSPGPSLPARQVSSWSIEPFGHSRPTSQIGQTGQRSDSIGRTSIQTVTQKFGIPWPIFERVDRDPSNSACRFITADVQIFLAARRQLQKSRLTENRLLDLHYLCLALLCGFDFTGISPKYLSWEKLDSVGYQTRWLFDERFSRFNTTTACGSQTDRHIDRISVSVSRCA